MHIYIHKYILTQRSLHDLTAGAALNFNISVASVNMNTGTRQLMVPLLLFYSRMQMTCTNYPG